MFIHYTFIHHIFTQILFFPIFKYYMVYFTCLDTLIISNLLFYIMHTFMGVSLTMDTSNNSVMEITFLICFF